MGKVMSVVALLPTLMHAKFQEEFLICMDTVKPFAIVYTTMWVDLDDDVDLNQATEHNLEPNFQPIPEDLRAAAVRLAMKMNKPDAAIWLTHHQGSNGTWFERAEETTEWNK